MNIQEVKQRFGIIGNSVGLNRAIETAIMVAPTDLSILISGESGTGKEVFSKIIHQYSNRKHNQYIAVNCGAIPDGTIDSELFGHEKGAFTGAIDSRKGYFEVVDKGTIFLDEVGELPLSTQVRLLRILETGEYIKVGSSKVQKTDVRVIAATNVNMLKAIEENKFRDDLYYRLNTVPIYIPPLRERHEDIPFLFKKFANDCCERYKMPPLKIDQYCIDVLVSYRWPGNIRQLKNIAEQIAVIEPNRILTPEIIQRYLPEAFQSNLPALIKKQDDISFANEREILYKILYDLKNDVNEMKKLIGEIIGNNNESIKISGEQAAFFRNKISQFEQQIPPSSRNIFAQDVHIDDTDKYAKTPNSFTDKTAEIQNQKALFLVLLSVYLSGLLYLFHLFLKCLW
ncbi:MAG: sigma-54 dependent transcriptional regulator [Bacteroidales bacterium]